MLTSLGLIFPIRHVVDNEGTHLTGLCKGSDLS